MGKKTKFYLVAADALPEIFLKVAEAKRMLHAGEVSTAGEAARQVGISRSAFYKYRDSVQPFNDMKTGRAEQRSFYFCRFGRKYTHHQPEHPDKRLRRRDHLGGDERYARIARGAHRQRCGDGGRGQV